MRVSFDAHGNAFGQAGEPKLTSNALSAHLSCASISSGEMNVVTSFLAFAERMFCSETFLKPSFSRTSW